MYDPLLVNNKEAGLEWKHLVTPNEFDPDFTGLIGEGTVIAAYAGGMYHLYLLFVALLYSVVSL